MKLCLLCVFLWCSPSLAEDRAPDFEVRVGLETTAKVPRWRVEAVPPAGHHFNLNAPFFARVLSEQTKGPAGAGVPFPVIEKSQSKIGFASSDTRLSQGQELEVTAFLCDKAKTYCVKKTSRLALRPQGELEGASRDKGRPSPKRDAHGFFVNDPKAAVAEAQKTGKPLLIDFFGIWCPPCNLYSERVFPSAEFKKLRRRFVLLKLDADREESFEWKSRYRVGGYPTIVVADAASLSEIGRIVGYLPPKEFSVRANGFVALAGTKGSAKAGAKGIEARIGIARAELLSALKDSIRISIEKKDPDGAKRSIQEGLALSPEDLELGLYGLEARLLGEGTFVPGPKDEEFLRKLVERGGSGSNDGISSDLALRAAYLLIDSADRLPAAWVGRAPALLDLLEKRLDRLTLFVPGTECSLADLAVLRMELSGALKEDALVKQHRLAAIQAYRWMIAKGGQGSRALHLELASLLSAEQRYEEAGAIYARFIRQYPAEFTFYFAAAKMFLEKNELGRARELAEQAVRHAYGDNLIRSMDRLLQVMGAQGEESSARVRGEEFLAGLRWNPALQVRTGRYVQGLKKTVESLNIKSPGIKTDR
jgi:thiol-disulfide isomerase/thioredoxin